MLIEDLLQFSRTNRTEKTYETSDLNFLLENAKIDLAEIIEEKKAIIENDVLPTLDVISFQIQQLFINLIGNSLKYNKENNTPIIKINYSIVIANDEEFLPDTHHEYHTILPG